MYKCCAHSILAGARTLVSPLRCCQIHRLASREHIDQSEPRASDQNSWFHLASRPDADLAFRAAIWISTAESNVLTLADAADELDDERENEPENSGARQSRRLSQLRSTPRSRSCFVRSDSCGSAADPELAVRRKVERASAWRATPRSTDEREE